MWLQVSQVKQHGGFFDLENFPKFSNGMTYLTCSSSQELGKNKINKQGVGMGNPTLANSELQTILQNSP